MNIFERLKTIHKPRSGALDLFKYIGPGLLVTVGFIDPGNWASNIAAGAQFGYTLLWVVTLSTIMLIVFQHNVAHLGIVSGLCLAEAATKYIPKKLSRPILLSALVASVSTSMAELLGGAIALQMIFGTPIYVGAIIVAIICLAMLFTNSYNRVEKWIITFVSIIGLSFLYELWLVDVNWGSAVAGWVTPRFPDNSMLVITAVLGAVVMPHNLFLHSEVIQSREWNLEDDAVIKKQLKYEYYDTLFSMIVGWGINSAMIIMAAALFFSSGQGVTELSDAQRLLTPLVGSNAGMIFAGALLLAGVSSAITSGIAGASIFAGLFGEAYQVKDIHSKVGVFVSFVPALLIIFLIDNPFQGLIYSQMLLSIQLPITVFTQVYLTSSRTIMGKYANNMLQKCVLITLAVIVTILNIALLVSLFS